MGLLVVIAAVVFAVSHVMLVLLSIIYVDWQRARERGVALQIFVFGGFRHKYTHEFVPPAELAKLRVLDFVRYYSSISLLVLLLGSLGYVFTVDA